MLWRTMNLKPCPRWKGDMEENRKKMSRIKRFEDLFVKLFELSGDGDKPRYINKKSLLRKLVDTDDVEGKCFEAIEIVLKEEEKNVEPVRHGHWIMRQFAPPLSDGDFMVKKQCSVCLTIWDAETNFCPHCGAKMDGKEVDSND